MTSGYSTKLNIGKDSFSVSHAQDIEPGMEYVHDRKKYNDNGFSGKRHFQELGVILPIFIAKQPELMYDDKAVLKFFKDHPEYRTCRHGSF